MVPGHPRQTSRTCRRLTTPLHKTQVARSSVKPEVVNPTRKATVAGQAVANEQRRGAAQWNGLTRSAGGADQCCRGQIGAFIKCHIRPVISHRNKDPSVGG